MNTLRFEATKLRDMGYSYKMIREKLGVSISTQSNWFSERPFTPNQYTKDRINNGQHKIGTLRHDEKIANIASAYVLAKDEIGILSERDIWMIGLGLYMGEGSKSIESVRIVNSDPDIIKLSMKWFRNVCLLNDDNFSLSLNLYPDSNELEAKKYWSKVTNLPTSSFRKTQIDIRTNKNTLRTNKLPYGTLQIRVKSNGDKAKGVALFRKIKGWSRAVFNQV